MENNDMVETAEAYYDGTYDEEVEEAEEPDNTEETDTDEDESYFDVDEDEDDQDSNEVEEDADDEESEAESDEEPGESEEKEEDPKGNEEKAKDESELESAVKAFLGTFGLKDIDNLPEKLKELTAESLGISLEDYIKRLESEKAQAASWEAQMQRDIDAIHEAFPVTKKYKTLKDLPNKGLFAQLMDDKTKNLSAVAAFAASHPDIVKAHSNAPARSSDLKGTKDHIKSNVPKGAKDTSTFISKGEMATYREMFPGLSDSEIKKLYKSANN